MFHTLHSKCYIDFLPLIFIVKSENPDRRRCTKETMTNSARKDRMVANPYVPNRGRGRGRRNIDGAGNSQPTHSLVNDLTHYQDQLHDTTNGGYDAHQFEEAVEGHDVHNKGQNIDHEVAQGDEDDDAAEATQLLEQNVFLPFESFDDNKVLKIVNWIC